MQSLNANPRAQSSTLCPDLTQNWQLSKVGQQVALRAKSGARQFLFSELEGFALCYFTGQFTVEQVQALCQQQADEVPPDFVPILLRKVIALEQMSSPPVDAQPVEPGIRLKPCIEWIRHPEGYWILRNPEDVTFLQVSDRDYQILQQLCRHSLEELEQHSQISSHQLHTLIQMLAVTGMLVGTEPAKPQRKRFTPLQLLFFRIPLCNPDQWLTRHVGKLHWIWTQTFAGLLTIFLVASFGVGLTQQGAIIQTGEALWATQGSALLLPFALLCGWVVAIHELGHAFTLKRFGGIVPEIGLLFVCLAPGCYTNTTDAYCLTRRWQRVLVVGAGVLCQLTLWATSFWLWRFLEPGTWLHTASFLLMAAALLTVVLNLNPLAKFDGYYLAVALTGINNLRARSFLFYGRLLKRQAVIERPQDRWVLAIYAPLSLIYSILVFGHFLLWVIGWILTHLPVLAMTLLGLWALYYYRPFSRVRSSKSMTSASSNSSSHANSEAAPNPTTNKPAQPRIQIPRRWLILGGVLCSIGVVSLIPVPNSISGEAGVDSTPGARQVITVPEAGTIQAIHVRLNDRVQAGQVVATLTSQDLEQQLAEIDRKLMEAISERETAKRQLQFMVSRQAELQVKADASAQKASRLQAEVAQFGTEVEPPQILQLKQQQAERQQMILGWQQQLQIVEAQLDRESPLVSAGALPMSRLDEARRQQVGLTSQIAAAHTQIQAIENQIHAVRKDLREEWQEQRQPETQLAVASLSSSAQEIAATDALVQKWERQIPLLQQEKTRLTERQQRLQLKATVAGIVTTPDLDLLVHQKLTEGKELLSIVDTQQATAWVQLTQADAAQIRVGMAVKFRLQDEGLAGFDAKIIEIPPIVTPESPQQPQQKPMVKVRIRLDAQGSPLTLGTKGYAHVQLESVPLYQKIRAELLKLIPVGRFI